MGFRRSPVLRAAVAMVMVALACSGPALAAPAVPAVRAGGTYAVAVRGEATQLSHPAFPGPSVVQVGSSVLGRPITAINRRGSVGADRTVVVVGVIHGDEAHGRAVTSRLLTAPLPAALDLWVIPSVNPDGEAVGGHRNARGVDLNRNWPANWKSGTLYSSGRYFSGSGPASEPEVRALMQFFSGIDPAITVWYHAPWNVIDCDVPRVGASCLGYAADVGRSTSFAERPGTATDWLMSAGLGVSFVVEFASGAPSANTVQAHVDAVLRLG